MRYSLHYTDFLSFTDDKMILQAIAVHDAHLVARAFWPLPFSLPKTIAFIPSGAKTQKKEIIHIPDAASERV